MTTFLSGDPTMYKAYNEGKDLYAIIAQSAFNNRYEDNLEFWPEGTELEIDGQKVIAGKKTHLNKAGKERRSVGKVLNLATCYGMSGPTAGARLGYSGKEAKEKGQELLDNFFKGFSGVKQAIDQSKEFLKKTGYVEDFLGRRRRLNDININPYEARLKVPLKEEDVFNPFLSCTDRELKTAADIWQQILDAYVLLSNISQFKKSGWERPFEVIKEMSNSKFETLKLVASNPKLYYNMKVCDIENKTRKKQDKKEDKKQYRDERTEYEKLIFDLQEASSAANDHFYRKNTIPSDSGIDKLLADYQAKYADNIPTTLPMEQVNLFAWTGRIAQAGRQCFNARIQGSAASLTKMAMVDIFNDPELRKYGAKLIITVHDEVLVECPEFYADQVEQRLPEIMINAAKRGGDDVPQSCDPYNVTRWYCDTAGAFIQEEFKKLEKGDKDKGILPLSRDEALQVILKNHSEIPEAAITKTIETGCDLEF